MNAFLAVFLGGGIGSVLRYGVQELMHQWIAVYNFPWATFAVNVTGSFLIGLFYALSAKFNMPGDIRLLLTAGLCGGFTTFSTFSNDCLLLLREGNWLPALAYVCASVIAGIAACMAGAWLGRA